MSVRNRSPLLAHVNSDIKQIMSKKDILSGSNNKQLNIEVVSNGVSTSRAKLVTGDIKSTDSDTVNEMSPKIQNMIKKIESASVHNTNNSMATLENEPQLKHMRKDQKDIIYNKYLQHRRAKSIFLNNYQYKTIENEIQHEKDFSYMLFDKDVESRLKEQN